MTEARGTRFRVGVVCLALVLLSACSPSRTWDVRGRIVGFGDDGRTVFISHENVPGFMPAMTMPFSTATPDESRGFHHGDAVGFVLHVNRDSTWISDLRLLEADAEPLVLEDAAPPSEAAPGAMLRPGDIVPDVELVDQNGESFQLSRYRGEYLLVNFIYTRCPLPDYCPWLTRRFAELYDPLKVAFGDSLALLSVTVDPAYDSPEVLRAYHDRHASSMEDWTFATGDPDEVHRLATALGVTYAAVSDEVVHALVTALIDTNGALDAVWRGNEWPIDEVNDRLATLTGR